MGMMLNHAGLPTPGAHESTSTTASQVVCVRPALEADSWRTQVPVLHGSRLTLREVQVDDAPALLAQLTTEETSRFMSAPPTSVEGFERFIRWSHQEREAGRHVCFVVIPANGASPVGMFQVRILDETGRAAEWGFAIGSTYWGTGLFKAGAPRVMDFAFREMGVRRLEARACVANGRGTGALRQLGAVCEAVLRQSFERCGERLDQALWTIQREPQWLLAVEPRDRVH